MGNSLVTGQSQRGSGVQDANTIQGIALYIFVADRSLCIFPRGLWTLLVTLSVKLLKYISFPLNPGKLLFCQQPLYKDLVVTLSYSYLHSTTLNTWTEQRYTGDLSKDRKMTTLLAEVRPGPWQEVMA